MNAITHGMTARIALLPDEDPAAFDRRMVQWVQRYRPQSDDELFQAERAAYSAWLVERSRRAQSARLVFKAQTALDEKRIREERESMELALRLFRLPGGGQSGKGDTHGNSEQQEGLAGLCGTAGRDDAAHPAQLVLGLEASESGCSWLLDRWNELKAVIEDERLAWQAPERFKAIRLLGIDSCDVIDAPAVIAILQACQMLDPEVPGLVDGFRNELRAANAGWSMERLCEWVPEMSLPADQAAARRELLEIVKTATDGLECKLKEHEEIGELEAKYSAHDRAFDHSSEGERMRRYETTCNRYVDRYLSELLKRKSNKAGNRNGRGPMEYTRPRTHVNHQTDGPSDSPEMADLTAFIDSIRKREREGTEAKAAMTAMPPVHCGATEPAEPPLRNEPKDTLAANSSQDETESVVTPEREVAAERGTGGILRNEAKPAAGSNRGAWQPKGWDNSRRARRAREAIGRAGGGRELDEGE